MPWPESELTKDPVALRFFKQLCQSCDRQALQVILARIVCPRLRRKDSWDEAADGLSREKMAAIAAQTREFTNTLRRIRRTVLVKHLVDRGCIPRGDLLHPSTPLKSLFSISRLDELARESRIGPLAKPDLCADIEHLVTLVKNACGQYHYARLDQILKALGKPLNIKQFRSDRRRAGKSNVR